MDRDDLAEIIKFREALKKDASREKNLGGWEEMEGDIIRKFAAYHTRRCLAEALEEVCRDGKGATKH